MKTLNKKQITELLPAQIYIEHLGLDSNDQYSVFQKEDDLINIVYTPNNINIQITSIDGAPNKLLRHKIYKGVATPLSESINQSIIIPVSKKFEMYRGYEVGNIFLLIHGIIKHPLLTTEMIQSNQEVKDISEKSGFQKIFLVFLQPREVVLVFDKEASKK